MKKDQISIQKVNRNGAQNSQKHIISSAEEEQKQSVKKTKRSHGQFQSNVLLDDNRSTFERLLAKSSILDKREKVEFVIEYVNKFDIFHGLPVHYKIRFDLAINAIKLIWRDPGDLPLRYFISFLGEEPRRRRMELWFDIDVSGKSIFEREDWLDGLDLWISGCRTLKGFVEIINTPSLLAFRGKGLLELDQKLKFRTLSLPASLAQSSILLGKAEERMILSDSVKNELQELYRPLQEHLDQLFKNISLD